MATIEQVVVRRADGRFLPGHAGIRRGRRATVLAQIRQAAAEQMTPEMIELAIQSLLGKFQAGDLQAGIMLFGKAAMERGLGGFDEEEQADQRTIKAALVASLRRRLGVAEQPVARVEDDLGAGI